MRNPKSVQEYWRKNPINNHGTKCWWSKPQVKTIRKIQSEEALLEDYNFKNTIRIESIQEKDKPALRKKCDCIIAECDRILGGRNAIEF